ncbi:MAG: hypothetical protein ACI4E1_07320 [Lachnospira sp.]
MKNKELSIWTMEDTQGCFILISSFFQFILFLFYKIANGLTFYIGNREIIKNNLFVMSYIVLSLLCTFFFVIIRKRNLITEIVAASLPVSVFLIFNIFGRLRIITVLYIMAIMVLVISFFALLVYRINDAKKRNKRICLRKYFKKRLFSYITAIVICTEIVSVIGLALLYNNKKLTSRYINLIKNNEVIDYSTIASSNNAEVLEEIGDLTIMEIYPDEIQALFDKETYESMSTEEKLENLQKVVNYSAAHLGIYEPVKICVDEDVRESILGFAQRNDNTVHLNAEQFNSSGKISVYVCFHETFHIFQGYMCNTYEDLELSTNASNLMIYREIKQWQYEFDNYIYGSKDFDAYEAQHLEKSANEYALSKVSEIIKAIDGEKDNSQSE